MFDFLSLAKFQKKPDKKEIGDTTKIVADWKAKGIKMFNWYWTLGCYAAVVIFEADSEKEKMKIAIEISEWVISETLVAIPREEAVKLL